MSENESYEHWYDNGEGSEKCIREARKSQQNYWKDKSISILFSSSSKITKVSERDIDARLPNMSVSGEMYNEVLAKLREKAKQEKKRLITENGVEDYTKYEEDAVDANKPICEEKEPREVLVLNKGISIITQLVDEANEYYRKKYGGPRKVEFDLPGNRLVSSFKSQNIYLWWTFCKGYKQDQNTGSDYFIVWGSLGDSGLGKKAMRSLFLFKGTTSMFHKHLTPETLDKWEEIVMTEL